MVLANNVIYSRDRDALHFPNGRDGVEIHCNVLLGSGDRLGGSLGRGLKDFQDLSWDAKHRDATPVADAPFDQGDDRYQPELDLNGNPRNQLTTIAGAVSH